MTAYLRSDLDTSIAKQLFTRSYGGGPVRQQPWLGDLSCEGSSAGTILVQPRGVGTPPFALEYSKVLHDRKYLAVADEEGYVTILDTTAPTPREIHEGWPPAQWLAHHNAIFDVAWCKDDSRIITASGDQTLRLWDTGHARCLGVFRGHNGSVKCVRAKPDCPDVFASGARDGSLMLWDSREPASWDDAFGLALSSPALVIHDAHKLADTAAESARKRRRSVGKRDSKQSVTSALFLQGGQVLASAGAGDGIVKFWDLRKADQVGWHLNPTSPTAQQGVTPTPRRKSKERPVLELPAMSRHPHGVNCLAHDPSGSSMLVSVSNNVHYLYDTIRPDCGPTAAFTGHLTSSFFVKACFSPDGEHILSGSSDSKAYIWQVRAPHMRPHVLEGHDREVTAVAWCPSDPHRIATCGDDATVKLWSLQRQWPPAQKAASQAEDEDDKLGLANAGWLHSLHEAVQCTEETDADAVAHHESSPTHTAAPIAENRALLNRPPGLPAESSTGATVVKQHMASTSVQKAAREPVHGTPFISLAPQEQDLLTMRPPVQPSTSARKQQRSIRDFFASPPLVPLAKRFKAQSSAPPDSALKPQSASRPEHHTADVSNITIDDTAAHTTGRHHPATQKAATASASRAEAPSCSGQHTSDASDQAPRVYKHSDCDPLQDILTGTGLASCSHFQQVASPTAVGTGSNKEAQFDASVAGHENKTGRPGGRSENCTDVDMENKENICSVIAAA